MFALATLTSIVLLLQARICYGKQKQSSHYKVVDSLDTNSQIILTLEHLDNDKKFVNDSISSFKNLKAIITFPTADIARIKIVDGNNERWEIPQKVIPHLDNTVNRKEFKLNYDIKIDKNPFSIEVTRLSDQKVVFELLPSIVYSDQYISFSTAVDPASKIYGLGESARTKQSLTRRSTHVLWATDTFSSIKDVNLYGSYPFYLELLQGKASGAMLFNRYQPLLPKRKLL